MVYDPKDPVNRQAKISAAYKKAHDGPPPQAAKAQQPEKSGSEMVKKSAPGMNGPTPPAAVRRPVVAQTYNQNLQAERDAAAKKLSEGAKSQQNKEPPDKSRTR